MLFLPQSLFSSAQSNAHVQDNFNQQNDKDKDEEAKRLLSAQLEHYIAHGARPPSARLDPSLKRDTPPFTITGLWKYGAFVASKATAVASDFLSHHIWGPRRKTWGIEMTILSAFMRDMAKHSGLADLHMLRALIQISGLVPLPSDAIVTPVTFPVKRRYLKGFLKEVDEQEDGTRMLSGEWIVSKRLWQRLQAEWRYSKQERESRGHHSKHKRKERVVLFLHGGAYYMFSVATHRMLTIALSKYTDARVFAVDYRLSPETPFPGQLHDAVSTYFRLLEDLHIPPENIIVVGDSAGGGLTMSLLLYLRDNNYPLPSGAILMSPWVDLTMSCDSWDSNAQYDLVPMPTHSTDDLNPVTCFLGPGSVEKYITHPYASPLFGDMHGLPPLLIQSGDAEVLRDEATLLAHKASLAGVKVRHELYEDQVHVFQMFFFLDAAKKALLSCREFVKHILPLQQTKEAKELGDEAESGMKEEIGGSAARVVHGDGTVAEENGGKVTVETPSPRPGNGRESSSSSGSDREVEPSWIKKDQAQPQTDTKVTLNPLTNNPAHTSEYVEREQGRDDGRESPLMFMTARTRRRSSQNSTDQTPTKTAPIQIRNGRASSVSHPHSPTTYVHSPPSPSALRQKKQSSSNLSFTSVPGSPTTHIPALGNLSPSSGSVGGRNNGLSRLPSAPSIRSRARATSHANIVQLVQSWEQTHEGATG